jgi:subtilisin family serine protease
MHLKTRLYIPLIIIMTFSFNAVSQNISKEPTGITVKLTSTAKADNLNFALTDFTIRQVFPNATALPGNKSGIDLSRYYKIQTKSKAQMEFLLLSLQKDQTVEWAEKDYPQELLYIPDDPLNESEQYYLNNIQAWDAWGIQQGDTNIIIGITDTGIDLDHEDLLPNIAYNYADPLDGTDNDNDGYTDNFRGWDMGDNDNIPQHVLNEHGTLVSGIASAATDNGLGISGAGFNCPVLPVKISETINDSTILLTRGYEGIIYAAEHGASIINCSWGNNYYSHFAQDMIDYVVNEHDVLVVASAGNNNDMRNFYPASYNNVLSVAATTASDVKWTPENTGTSGGSTYGYHVDVSAPGTMMHTTEDGGTYRMVYAGTSFASPLVSGVAGLIRSEYPGLSALQVLERIKNTTDNIDTIPANIPYAGLLGTGRVNAYKALSRDFSPGVKFQDVQVSDDRENNYEDSRLVQVRGEFFNYLASADNLSVAISCDNPDITLMTTTIDVGTLDSLNSYPVAAQPIEFELDEDVPANETVVLTLNMTDGDWQRTQYIEILVNPSWKQLSNDKIDLSVPANGLIGFTDPYRNHGNGLRYEGIDDLFYDAGLMTGSSGNVLFDCIRGSNDFSQTGMASFADIDNVYQSVKGSFYALDQANSVNLEIVQTSMLKTETNNYIILNYDIVNHNLASVDDWYLGLFFDWDLIIPVENTVSWDSTRMLGYTEHTGDMKLYSGIRLLSNQHSNHYAIDQAEVNELINMTNGFSDDEKFYALSHTRNTAGTEPSGSDVVQISSAGPFDIPPQDTTRVSFAVMMADSYTELQAATDSALVFYNEWADESGKATIPTAHPALYPNPCNGRFYVSLPESEHHAELSIYSTTGQKLVHSMLEQGQTLIQTSLIPGHYIVEIKTPRAVFQKQLIISGVD